MKYTKELLQEAANHSSSVMDVIRYVKCPISGGAHGHITRRLKKFNIDISHFKKSLETFKSAARKRSAAMKISAESILVFSPNADKRTKTKYLVRALKEIGVEYKCSKCKITEYNDLPMSFEVDHIDGNWRDNRRENLRFICPNCHSQEVSNYTKNVKYTDEKILEACKSSPSVNQVAVKLGTGSYLYPRIKQIAQRHGIQFYE